MQKEPKFWPLCLNMKRQRNIQPLVVKRNDSLDEWLCIALKWFSWRVAVYCAEMILLTSGCVLRCQWRTQKVFMRGFHSVAHGGHLHLVCVVCDVIIWRHTHIHAFKLMFGEIGWDNMHIFLHALPLFYVNTTISTEYKLSAL